MSNSSNPVNALMGGLVAFFGLFFLATPVAVLLGDSDLGPTRPFYIVAGIGGALMLIGGVQMMGKQRSSLRRETQHRESIRATVGPPPIPAGTPSPAGTPAAATTAAAAQRTALPTGEPVLAHWTFAAGEWKRYMAAEWKRRLLEGAFLGGLMALIAWTIFRNEPEMPVWKLAIGAGVVFFLVPVVRALSVRHTDPSAPAEAIITPRAVLLNGKYHVLEDGRIRFGAVQVTELGGVPVLEFTIQWQARGRPIREHLRIPIPPGREAEAQAVVKTFNAGWSADTPWLTGQEPEAAKGRAEA